MTNLPALPPTPDIQRYDDARLTELAQGIVLWVDDHDDPDELIDLWEQIAPWDGVLKHMTKEGKKAASVLAATRWAEIRIGEEDPRPGKGVGGGRPSKTSIPGTLVSPFSRLNKRHRGEFRRLADVGDRLKPEIAEAAEANNYGKVTRRHLLKRADELTPVTKTLHRGDESGDGWTMMHGDMQDRLTEIEEGTVDFIFTDPPYPKEALPLYGDLAQHSARLLKPRGVLVTYAGLIFLPEVIDHLRPTDKDGKPLLNYGWTFCLSMTEGSQSRIMGRHIIQGWKPLIAMTKGTWTSGEWMNDPIRSGGRDKPPETTGWRQDTETAATLISRFTRPGEIVLDPFMGTGTTGVAALATGRQVIGVEADEARFVQSVERLRDLER